MIEHSPEKVGNPSPVAGFQKLPEGFKKSTPSDQQIQHHILIRAGKHRLLHLGSNNTGIALPHFHPFSLRIEPAAPPKHINQLDKLQLVQKSRTVLGVGVHVDLPPALIRKILRLRKKRRHSGGRQKRKNRLPLLLLVIDAKFRPAFHRFFKSLGITQIKLSV